jgi:methylmalonyl-CoA carboxyltransferase large subunit
MTLDAADQRSMLETLDALRREVARLGDRVAAVEAVIGTRPTTGLPNQSHSLVEGVGEEVITVISAAIAAYLGVKPHIRQISLVGGAFWAQQGRVTIQASHTFAVRHD